MNGNQYHSNTMDIYLKAGDVIGFGSRTFDYEDTDTMRYVYRVDRRPDTNDEIIDLISDDEVEDTPRQPTEATIDDLSSESDDDATTSSANCTSDGGHDGQSDENRSQVDANVWERIQRCLQKKKEIAEARIIAAKPIRQRRRTLIDMEHTMRATAATAAATNRRSDDIEADRDQVDEAKRQRLAKLAEIGEQERLIREEAERIAAANRVRAEPKVKRTMLSRNEKLVWNIMRDSTE